MCKQEPVRIVLGSARTFKRVKNKIRCLQVEKVFYYIPILKTLQEQLKSKSILKMVYLDRNCTQANSNSYLEDFDDGLFVRTHPLFSTEANALKLLIYYDDMNVANPMTNKVHSLGLFYYQLVNINPVYRGKLKSIHLFAISKKEHIKEFGINELLKPLVDDLKRLGSETGQSFNIWGGTINLRGAILAVIADTPASQAVGSFKESVGGSRRKCRHCFTNWEQMQEHFTEEEFVLRSSDHHEEQVSIIENAGSDYLKKYFSKEFGINDRAKIMEAPYFNVTKQLPQDVMHIFLEGIISYEMKFLLKYLFDARRLTLHYLNNEIDHFAYGYSEKKDKPSPIKEVDLEFQSSSNLGQSASQMFLLACIFPFILDGKVANDDPHWITFLSLLEIMAICFSHKVTFNSVINLKQLVKEHLTSFKRVYAGARILPKQHYLVHLPTQIMMFGPLIRSWCMRFEAKHAYFKDLSRKIKNFKNLPLSLAERHQSMESAAAIKIDRRCDTDECDEDVKFGKGKMLLNEHEIEYARNNIKMFYEIAENFQVLEYNSITVHGTCYKPGTRNYVIIGLDSLGLPLFGKLTKIWFVPYYGPFFVVMAMKTTSFCEQMNAFEILEPEIAQGHDIVVHADLLYYQVFHTHNVRGAQYIVVMESILTS